MAASCNPWRTPDPTAEDSVVYRSDVSQNEIHGLLLIVMTKNKIYEDIFFR